MKVKDLIEKLKDFNPEEEIYLADWSEEYCTPHRLAKIDKETWEEERVNRTGIVLNV